MQWFIMTLSQMIQWGIISQKLFKSIQENLIEKDPIQNKKDVVKGTLWVKYLYILLFSYFSFLQKPYLKTVSTDFGDSEKLSSEETPLDSDLVDTNVFPSSWCEVEEENNSYTDPTVSIVFIRIFLKKRICFSR
jgi:hypothetical protein